MRQADQIRKMATQGYSRARIRRLLGCSLQAIASALKHQRAMGAPPKERCKLCGAILRNAKHED